MSMWMDLTAPCRGIQMAINTQKLWQEYDDDTYDVIHCKKIEA